MTRTLATDFPRPCATFASIVTERMRDGIVDGSLAPGMQLSEVEHANRFGVSRGPVREAIQRLLQESLGRSEPRRGVLVRVLADEDVIDVYIAGSAPESAALKILIGTRKPGAVDTLGRYAEDMESAAARGDWEVVGRFALGFHCALVSPPEPERPVPAQVQHLDLRDEALSGRAGGLRCRAPSQLGARTIRQGRRYRTGAAAFDKHNDDAVTALTSTRHGGDGRGLLREDEAT